MIEKESTMGPIRSKALHKQLKKWLIRTRSIVNRKGHVLKPRAATWKYCKTNHAKLYHRLNIWLIHALIPNSQSPNTYLIRNVYDSTVFVDTPSEVWFLYRINGIHLLAVWRGQWHVWSPPILTWDVKIHLLQRNDYDRQ